MCVFVGEMVNVMSTIYAVTGEQSAGETDEDFVISMLMADACCVGDRLPLHVRSTTTTIHFW